jgi:hypothetical protein
MFACAAHEHRSPRIVRSPQPPHHSWTSPSTVIMPLDIFICNFHLQFYVRGDFVDVIAQQTLIG